VAITASARRRIASAFEFGDSARGTHEHRRIAHVQPDDAPDSGDDDAVGTAMGARSPCPEQTPSCGSKCPNAARGKLFWARRVSV